VEGREKASVGRGAVQQLPPRAGGFVMREVEGTYPIRMFELRRIDNGVTNVEQLLPPGRNQDGGVPGRVARRGKHQYPGCHFRGLIEEPQVVPRRR
jgi:hypothetical protein